MSQGLKDYRRAQELRGVLNDYSRDIGPRATEPAAMEVEVTCNLILSMPVSCRRKLEHLYLQQDGECFYCGVRMFIAPMDTASKPRVRSDFEATVDHIVSRANGGQNTKGNSTAACNYCNHHKNTMDVVEFLGSNGWSLVANG